MNVLKFCMLSSDNESVFSGVTKQPYRLSHSHKALHLPPLSGIKSWLPGI